MIWILREDCVSDTGRILITVWTMRYKTFHVTSAFLDKREQL